MTPEKANEMNIERALKNGNQLAWSNKPFETIEYGS
jgi:hypothetical protein